VGGHYNRVSGVADERVPGSTHPARRAPVTSPSGPARRPARPPAAAAGPPRRPPARAPAGPRTGPAAPGPAPPGPHQEHARRHRNGRSRRRTRSRPRFIAAPVSASASSAAANLRRNSANRRIASRRSRAPYPTNHYRRQRAPAAPSCSPRSPGRRGGLTGALRAEEDQPPNVAQRNDASQLACTC